jgi:D-threo-aldose 1-dehydrogenase
MKYTEIKNSGIKIPIILFGTSALGNLYHALDKNTKLSIVRECLRSLDGPVVFDSAGKYGAGLALEELGRLLSFLDADPERVIISNKLGWIQTELKTKEPVFEKGVWMDIHHDAKQAISAEGIISCWEQGNQLLGEKYRPRLLSVHDPDEYLATSGNDSELRMKLYNDILDAYKALFEIKKSNSSISIGVGAKDWKVIREISNDIDLDWAMFANSLTLFSHPGELISFITRLHSKGVTIINSAVFNAGFLIGGDYFNYRLINRENPEHRKLFAWRDSFFKICDEFSISPSSACIRFGMSHPAVSAIALNTSNPVHVKRNVEEVQNEIPAEFFGAMKNKGLIEKEYPFV